MTSIQQPMTSNLIICCQLTIIYCQLLFVGYGRPCHSVLISIWKQLTRDS